MFVKHHREHAAYSYSERHTVPCAPKKAVNSDDMCVKSQADPCPYRETGNCSRYSTSDGHRRCGELAALLDTMVSFFVKIDDAAPSTDRHISSAVSWLENLFLLPLISATSHDAGSLAELSMTDSPDNYLLQRNLGQQ